MNMLKTEAPKGLWCDYTPGYFPDNVASIAYPNSSTVVFHLKTSLNPTWFLYNELSQITPMPMAWDRTSSSGADSDREHPQPARHDPGRRRQGLQLPQHPGHQRRQLRLQPALDGGGRAVEAAELHDHGRGHLRAQPGLQRLAQTDAVEVRRGALHVGRGHPQRDQVRRARAPCRWPSCPTSTCPS